MLNYFFFCDTENKQCGELEKRRRHMNSTTLSQKESGSFYSEKRKRRYSGHISDDCNAHIPQKSLVFSVSCMHASTHTSAAASQIKGLCQ